MDLNRQYADHQHAIMRAERAGSTHERVVQLTRAASIATGIGAFQRTLGAAAACAWSMAQVSAVESA